MNSGLIIGITFFVLSVCAWVAWIIYQIYLAGNKTKLMEDKNDRNN